MVDLHTPWIIIPGGVTVPNEENENLAGKHV
jgi:hypothetical protein